MRREIFDWDTPQYGLSVELLGGGDVRVFVADNREWHSTFVHAEVWQQFVQTIKQLPVDDESTDDHGDGCSGGM